MPVTTVLEIIRLSLEITLEVVKGVPPEQRAAMWERHERRMEFWERLFNRFEKEN